MITNVVQFPRDRCRPAAAVVEATEQLTFDRAARRYAAKGGHEDIIAMMRLALGGVCAGPRMKAAQWLHRHCNVLIWQQEEDARNKEQSVL